jgi:hypothetical protein
MVERKIGNFHKVILFIYWWEAVPTFQMKSLSTQLQQGLIMTTVRIEQEEAD